LFGHLSRYPRAVPPTRTDPPAERAPAVLRRLTRAYPDARVALDFSTPLECVVATILSAQSTDVRVNMVTPGLFVKYPTPEAYLAVPEEELKGSSGRRRGRCEGCPRSCSTTTAARSRPRWPS
jgi:hypothetical protein